MKIEALTKKMNADIRGKVPKEEKLRAVISETMQRAGTYALASGDFDDPGQKHAITLAAGCQMLWNALEDAKAEIERLKKEVDDAFERGYNEGSLETEHSMQENS